MAGNDSSLDVPVLGLDRFRLLGRLRTTASPPGAASVLPWRIATVTATTRWFVPGWPQNTSPAGPHRRERRDRSLAAGSLPRLGRDI